MAHTNMKAVIRMWEVLLVFAERMAVRTKMELM